MIKLHNSSHLLKVCLNNANRTKLIMTITIKKKNKDFKKSLSNIDVKIYMLQLYT